MATCSKMCFNSSKKKETQALGQINIRSTNISGVLRSIHSANQEAKMGGDRTRTTKISMASASAAITAITQPTDIMIQRRRNTVTAEALESSGENVHGWNVS